MDVQRNYEKVRQLLNSHNQSHLLRFWGELDTAQRKKLLSRIENLDFENIDRWIEKYVKNSSTPPVPANISPAPVYPATASNAGQKLRYDKARETGRQLIASGKVAAFIVAGGQGTRLGYDGPKGNFPISPIRKKTLFRIFAETILAARKKYNRPLVWYIMTSPINHAATMEIFEKNDYFGLDRKNIFVFQQGTIPNFDFNGKILLSAKDDIACSPDGHGGSLRALYTSGALEDMKNRGIEFISYFQVDNPLINIFDTLFIGLHSRDGTQMSSKALIKAEPKEKVGNFCLANGKVTVIEYSDLSDELAEKKNSDGTLVFSSGSIAIHIINVDFVEQLNSRGFALPIHRAVKKIPHLDENGKMLTPQKPNGIKLETFVFDALPLGEKSIILETLRGEEFAPVKNAQGPDSPEVTRRMMINRAAGWLKSAGIDIPTKPDGSVDCEIEIAPSFAIAREDVLDKKDLVPRPIKTNQQLYLT